MIEHNASFIYWLILFVGVITLFYRFCEKTARDRLQGTKDEIADLMRYNERFRDDIQDGSRDLINQVNGQLREMLKPVERGVLACAVTSILIFVFQIYLFVCDMPDPLTIYFFVCDMPAPLTKDAVVLFFAVLILALFVNSCRVFRAFKSKEEELDKALRNAHIKINIKVRNKIMEERNYIRRLAKI